jgi:crotonobetainyl-CoA:carnitine CoA-transferase CaiB-like acyl-CoA transferase
MSTTGPPLSGVRVVERARGLAAVYAGHLLCELGAEVVKVEAPGVARETPGDHVVNRGKRSVVLDPERAADAACRRRLDEGAAVILTDASEPRPDACDGAVRCRVTPWGPHGHPAGLPDEEPLVAAATGVQALQWSWAGRPVWLVTPMIAYMTGMLGALGTVAALFARARGAPGQAVDVSAVGGAFALNSGTYVTGAGHRGSLSAQGDPRGVYPTYGIYRTADGWLFVGALTQAFWVKLMTTLDRVDLLVEPRLQGNPLTFGTPEVKELVRTALAPIFAARSNAEWVRVLREADIPCGAVGTRETFLRDPEARALGLVVPVEDPRLGPTWQPAGPALFSDTPLDPPRPAPVPGADTERVRAEVPTWRPPAAPPAARPPRACLAGIRVLDLTSFIAGPFCPMLLADLGADVVKVESADGDPFRMAAFGFVGWNRGKRSLVLDLKRPEGRAVLLDVARGADVLVDNFRAGVMERLGIGSERLRAANPRLVHTSITGYGSEGPLATLPGFDPVFQARSGLMAVQGGADEPVLHMVAYTDYCAGALGALATVAALCARERTGRGQRVDVSLFRTAFASQAAAMLLPPVGPEETGGRDFLGPSASRRLYACRDGWVCVAAADADAAAALGRMGGVSLGSSDPADGVGAEAVARALGALARADALERLRAAGVPAAPCLGFPALFDDPYLRAAGWFVEQEQPGLGPVLLGGPLIGFEATPVTYRRPAPVLGGDGAAVLREAGYDEGRIAALVASGIVGPGAPPPAV